MTLARALQTCHCEYIHEYIYTYICMYIYIYICEWVWEKGPYGAKIEIEI